MLFFHGILQEEVYMEQPSDFIVSNSSSSPSVCKLNKEIYGLKQVP